ncbi:MAG: carbohydrate kinase family protein, partial [Proteobacteria bacterium]|nr:carbohydrate kinase family protein [Pseudomonadota bacterium]
VTMHNGAVSFLLVEQGRKVQAESISSHVGGGAANVAVSLRRQGLESAIFGMTGQDLNAEKVRKHLRQEGVSLDHLLIRDDMNTGTAVHISAHDHDAAIFVSRGANTCLRPSHVEALSFEDFDMVYVASLSDESSECFPYILEKAQDAGAFVVSNPGVRQISTRPDELLNNLHRIDLLALNRDETAALIPHILRRGDARFSETFNLGDIPPSLLTEGLHIAGFTMGFADAMTTLCALGPKRVLVTDGSDGAYMSDGDTLFYGPTVPVTPKGSAGAGDSFTSTVAAEIFKGASPQAALLAGSINAASVVGAVDAQSGLLDTQHLANAVKSSQGTYSARSWPLLPAGK